MQIKIDAEDIACLLVIIVGGVFGILYPDQIKDAFQGTLGSIILIKLLW